MLPRLAIDPDSSAFNCSRCAISRATGRVTGWSMDRPMRRSVSRMRSSGNTRRKGDCSSATARATFNARSNTGSPVVLVKSAMTIVSCSVSGRAVIAGLNDHTSGTTASSAAAAIASSTTRARGRVPDGVPGSSAIICTADSGRCAGSGASACMIRRSSFGFTSDTRVDGRAGCDVRDTSANARCPTTSS